MLGGKPLAQWIAQRLMAAYQLAGCGPNCSQALPALQRKLDDRDDSVRIGVARAIVNIDATGPQERAIYLQIDAVRNGLSQRGGTVRPKQSEGLETQAHGRNVQSLFCNKPHIIGQVAYNPKRAVPSQRYRAIHASVDWFASGQFSPASETRRSTTANAGSLARAVMQS